jgi:hypothetical protein
MQEVRKLIEPGCPVIIREAVTGAHLCFRALRVKVVRVQEGRGQPFGQELGDCGLSGAGWTTDDQRLGRSRARMPIHGLSASEGRMARYRSEGDIVLAPVATEATVGLWCFVLLSYLPIISQWQANSNIGKGSG